MIIECINCNKKFNINSDLIPDDGRSIQCGSCGHTWFFKKKDNLLKRKEEIKIETKFVNKKATINQEKKTIKDKKKIVSIPINSKKDLDETKNLDSKPKKKSNFKSIKILSYILVLIITFIAIMIILDTFKIQIYQLMPNLEFILFSFYETLKDMKLFFQDLIQQ